MDKEQKLLEYKQRLIENEQIIRRIKAKDQSVLQEWNFDDFDEGLELFEDDSKVTEELIQELLEEIDEEEAYEHNREIYLERASICHSQGLAY